MDDVNSELLAAIREIRDCVRLLAEPAIAQRDEKLRNELKRIVGKSVPKSKAVFAMDGTRSQRAIHQQTGINEGNLSTLVKQLGAAKLLSGDSKQPKLAISIPSDFFQQEAE